VASKAVAMVSASGRRPGLWMSMRRSSQSSSVLTVTVVVASRSGQLACSSTRSGWNSAS
jgi:hypothetical protein